MIQVPRVGDVLVGVVLKRAWGWIRRRPKPEVALNDREEIIMHEAFMTGRIYSQMGEKERPGEMWHKVRENCLKALRREEP